LRSRQTINALTLCACSLLGACTLADGGLFSRDTASTSSTPRSGTTVSSEGIAVYLRILADLLEGDAVIQAETFQTINDEAAAAPNTTNRLKLAIALAVPGHSGSNAEHAQRELRELLAASEVLLPEERILATLLLGQVEQRLLLDLEAQQTQSAAAESIQRQSTDAEQRLRQVQDENRVLRQQLQEAQNVIDELTDIERSIRERESANQR
jgi:hypothetical protein